MVQQQAKYNDPTPNNFPDDYDESKVDGRIKLRSKAIRGKDYGIDVRGALAQGIEIAGAIAGESVANAADAKSISQDTQNRFDDQIAESTNDNEVIDARRPAGGDAFATLGERLNATDANLSTLDTASAKSIQAYLDNEAIDVGGAIPSYYKDKIVEIASTVSSNTFNVGFITDNHYQMSTYAPNSLAHYAYLASLSRVAPVAALISGGDNTNGYYPRAQSLAETRQATSTLYYRANMNSDVFFLKGNHDTGAQQQPTGKAVKNKPELCITYDELKTFYQTNNLIYGESRDDGSFYACKDYSDYKIRVIMLDAFDLPETLAADGTYQYDFLRQSAFGNKQLNWLATKALMLPSPDWQVMIFSHACISGGLDTIPQYNTTPLVSVLNAFQAGTTLNVDGGDVEMPVLLSADFSNQGTGTIIAFVSGHKHADGQMFYQGINCIETTGSLCNGDGRVANTDTEDAWDLFSVDPSARSIIAHRFGFGTDRSFTY